MLRILSLASGLVCLYLIARLMTHGGIMIGNHPIGLILSFTFIAFTGYFSIRLVKLSGPWSPDSVAPSALAVPKPEVRPARGPGASK